VSGRKTIGARERFRDLGTHGGICRVVPAPFASGFRELPGKTIAAWEGWRAVPPPGWDEEAWGHPFAARTQTTVWM